MHPAEYTGLGVFMASILGFMWKVNKSNERKVSGQSFERFKTEVRKEYVEVKICSLEHKHVKETLDRLETGQKEIVGKIDTLLRNGSK